MPDLITSYGNDVYRLEIADDDYNAPKVTITRQDKARITAEDKTALTELVDHIAKSLRDHPRNVSIDSVEMKEAINKLEAGRPAISIVGNIRDGGECGNKTTMSAAHEAIVGFRGRHQGLMQQLGKPAAMVRS